jgi:hypothetical protein
VLNKLYYNIGFIISYSLTNRYYSYKVDNKFIKIDARINNKFLLTTSKQDVRNKSTEGQGDLNIIKKEILCESNLLTPLLINSIELGRWPMLTFNKEIRNLVKKRQKYLSMLSNQYGFRSTHVIKQIEEWVSKLDLRVFAIETVYRTLENPIFGVTNQMLKRENLLDYCEILRYNNLKYYKGDSSNKYICRKCKNNKHSLELITI